MSNYPLKNIFSHFQHVLTEMHDEKNVFISWTFKLSCFGKINGENASIHLNLRVIMILNKKMFETKSFRAN